MSLEWPTFRWRLKPRETRMLIYLVVLAGIVAWKFAPRPWHPAITFEAPHHRIFGLCSWHFDHFERCFPWLAQRLKGLES